VVGDSIHFDGVVGTAHEPGHAGVAGHNPGGTAGFFEGSVTVTEDMTVNGNINVASGKDIFLADCAEEFDASEHASIEPGTLVVFDEAGTLEPSRRPYDKRVAGVVSGAGNCRPAIVLDKQRSQGRRVPLALVGKVYCKVDAQYAPVQVGDLLTTSQTPGHAMKASDAIMGFGAVIGKALSSLESGQGTIPVLIALH
jgi:hypothetical protein